MKRRVLLSRRDFRFSRGLLALQCQLSESSGRRGDLNERSKIGSHHTATKFHGAIIRPFGKFSLFS